MIWTTRATEGAGRPARRNYQEPAVAERYSGLEVLRDRQANIAGQTATQPARTDHLARVRHVVALASGKGGVGKSALSANLAVALARRGLDVGLLDADVNGGMASRLLGIHSPARIAPDEFVPALGAAGVRVMSIDLFMPDEPGGTATPEEHMADLFAWQGLREDGALRGFLAGTAWGELDILLIDLPSGPAFLAMLAGLLPGISGAVLVALPADLAHRAMRRAVAALREARMRPLGLVLNMAAMACAACGEAAPLYPDEAGPEAAARFDLPLLGAVPFDPALVHAVQAGEVYMLEHGQAPAAQEVHRIAAALVEELER